MTRFPSASPEPAPDFPFRARRERLLAHMLAQGGGVAVVPTAPERERNRGTNYPYRPDSQFLYLSGFREPEAVLVLVASETPRQFLFCRARDEGQEIWTGYRHGPEAAAERFGFDAAWPVDEFERRLPELLADQPALWTGLAVHPEWDRRILAALERARANVRAGTQAPRTVHEISAALDEMRLVKDAAEIALMRRAGEISAAAHCQAMRAVRAGRFEYEIEAELLRVFRAAGSQFPAYPSIVASGPNACVLHYVDNDRRMADGELLLIDAGCELDGYASDITRTFPVTGRFSGPQRDLYQLVLAANRAAHAAVRPGNDWNAPHEAAVAALAQGFADLGLLAGATEDLIETGAYRRFYMHRTGHWLGLDVHDAGAYKIDGKWRPFAPGMTLTIEPGCYIRPADDVPEAFWNIGIRIEDNVLVTASGCECLTGGAPREVDEIEALIAAGRDGA
ncbi:MAG: aminopeptidase P N-terminal domain-containing protein [Azoarcus sp.]|jgi:Xaa-Pro aminopeptidase|nr:aminopeptidase P N-terminal domain-containing protein [Azoarcus sp.]